MSYIRHYFHIVFSPKGRQQVLVPSIEKSVYNLLYNQIMKFKGYVYCINGTKDHIHLLVSLPTTVAHSEVVKILKQESSKMIREQHLIPFWPGWEEGYASFTCGFRELNRMRQYIQNQKEHHRRVPFIEEYRNWLIENGISPEDPYFPKDM